MVKSVSCCCVRGRRLFSNPVTYCKLDGLRIKDVHSLKHIFNCRYLRCLLLDFSRTPCEYPVAHLLPLEVHCSCLQELYINDTHGIVAETFINALCAHGGLEHVVLCVNSLKVKSITNLIEHSPNLLTFEVNLDGIWKEGQLKDLIAHVRTKFFRRRLIDGGFFNVNERMKN